MKRQVIWLSALVVMVAFGCGRRAEQKASNVPAAPEAAVPLPEWAPKNPSPEFLRAARVLKPILFEESAGQQASPASQAIRARKRLWLPALYEFFGTLSDQQIETFLSKREIRIPVKSLSAAQRAALDKWFDAFADAMKDIAGAAGGLVPPLTEDYRVLLYRKGAKEDLSNVKVGFSDHGAHIVHIQFWIRKPDGTEDGPSTSFAQI